MNKSIRIKNNKSWKEQLREVRKEYRTISRPCLAMATDRFNELMRDYQVIKPDWSYKKRKAYLQWIIDNNDERKYLTKSIIYSKQSQKRYAIALGSDCSRGSHHALSWLDDTLDNVLDNMGRIDLSQRLNALNTLGNIY